MLIDSHCHLPDLSHSGVAQTQIENAKSQDIVGFINIGTSLEDSLLAAQTAEAFKEVYCSVAVYPHENEALSLPEIETGLTNLLTNRKKIVAIGECGIDVTEDGSGRPLAQQIELFALQIKLALQYDLPLIIHNRTGDEQVLSLLEQHKGPKLRGVIHCFSSSWETAKRFLYLGFSLSFSAFITYPSKVFLAETVENVPLDRFLVETDSPFLSPQGMRNKPNEPKNVKIVAQKVAEIRNLPFEVIADNSFKNTCKLFNLAL